MTKSILIEKAIEKSGKILLPCIGKKSLSDCFTDEGEYIFLWYNTPDHSTHIVKVKKNK